MSVDTLRIIRQITPFWLCPSHSVSCSRFTTGSPYSNTVGWCVKHALPWRDTNGDSQGDAPYPRCPSLTAGADTIAPLGMRDDVQFWCIRRSSSARAGAGPWLVEAPAALATASP